MVGCLFAGVCWGVSFSVLGFCWVELGFFATEFQEGNIDKTARLSVFSVLQHLRMRRRKTDTLL